jgi:hypothetical protein
LFVAPTEAPGGEVVSEKLRIVSPGNGEEVEVKPDVLEKTNPDEGAEAEAVRLTLGLAGKMSTSTLKPVSPVSWGTTTLKVNGVPGTY